MRNINDWQNRHRDLNISKQEIERKWRVHLWEEEQRALAESIAMRDALNSVSSVSSAGGGSSTDSNTIFLSTEEDQILMTESGDNIIISTINNIL